MSRPQIIGSTSQYSLDLSVTDGKFTDMSKLNILVKKSGSSGLAFSKSRYYASVLENSTRSEVVLVVDVLGSALNENLEFKLLNPSDMFTIGLTPGMLSTSEREW